MWRGRALVWIALASVVSLSWVYLVRADVSMSAMMPNTAHHHMPMSNRPILPEITTAFLMWTIMMVAMMIPSTTQSLSIFMTLSTKRASGRSVSTMTIVFAMGYVTMWIGFSLLAAASQVTLSHAALLTPMVQSASVVLSVVILLLAGLFQFTSLKDACLVKCRTPLGFFLAEWRDGAAGAFRMGFRHGGYCVLCCWALMAVMFVVGAMNLLWMAALTLFVMVEKLAPPHWHLSRIAGICLILWASFVAMNVLV